MVKAIVFSLIFMFLSPTVAYAAKGDVDPYGNVIEWGAVNEISENGYEDMDGAYTGDPVPYDEEASIATEEEKQKNLEEYESYRQEFLEENGLGEGDCLIDVILDDSENPSDFDNEDINITLWNMTTASYFEATISASNDWYVSCEALPGNYTFWKAETESGYTFDCSYDSFTLEDGYWVLLTLTLQGDDLPEIIDVNDSGYQEDTSSGNANASDSSSYDEQSAIGDPSEITYIEEIEEDMLTESERLTRRIVIVSVILVAAVALIVVSVIQNRRQKNKQ